LATHYPGPHNLPTRPNIEHELLIWEIPAVIVWMGLALQSQFGSAKVVAAGVLLLLLNPAIVAIGVRLSLPLSL
jgi:hypothetical protein